ncbi:hypothetical protein [Nocardiopsis synnemataformans]|uniref:hypothetical protein n=1 Tax=Nocardiopsis synnemataformans TaxID=61305 RepID=UPI003EB74D6C
MFHIGGFDGGSPTRLLARHLGNWRPRIDGPTYADLVVYPVRDYERNADRWYDVYYTHQTVQAETDIAGDALDPVVNKKIAKAATLPAPPRIPWEQRLADAPEPTVDHLTEEQIRIWFGDRDKALESARTRQEIAIREDRTAETWDWEAAAEIYRPILDAIEPRKLTAAQRVHVARVRVLEAENELASARASLEALEANAARPAAKA